MYRRFAVEFLIDGMDLGLGIVDIHEDAISRVDNEWRSMLYELHTPEEIAEHIAHNLINNNIGLSQMDGWADMPDNYARVIRYPDIDFELRAMEIKNERER